MPRSERDTTRPLTRGRRGVCLPWSADLTADPFGMQRTGPRTTDWALVLSPNHPHQRRIDHATPNLAIFDRDHLTTPRRTLPHLATRRHVTSRHITSHLASPRRVHHPTSRCISPHLAASRHIPLYLATSRCTSLHLATSHCVSPRLAASRLQAYTSRAAERTSPRQDTHSNVHISPLS